MQVFVLPLYFTSNHSLCCLFAVCWPTFFIIQSLTVSRRGWKVEEKFVGNVMKLKTHELGLKRSSHGVNYILRY